jgi:hypothetical protein
VIAYFVVSWFGRAAPELGTPGIVRGVHGRAGATREASYWNERLAQESGGLAIFCKAFEANRARRLFDLRT